MFSKPANSNIQKGNIPSINNSNNNMAKDDKYQHEINELKRKNKIAERTKQTATTEKQKCIETT